jgi:alpha-galactosidase
MLVAPAWSGNWHIDITEGQVLTAGISDWLFETELEAGMSLEAPSVVVAFASSIDQAGVEMSSAIGRAWAPRSPASERFDVEWNHWWPYEDVHVNESVIVANSVIADRVGIDMVTVDAGWFGPSERKSSWPRYRGDWERVNEARFPAGLPELARGVRANGVRTGIWIEAEAIGRDATIRRERPEIVALAPEGPASDPSYQAHGTGQDPDDPTFLGYVCCGSEAGRRFVAESLERTVKAFDAEWVKLDFNVDPGAGCTRTDHGHGPMDGLFRHYEGLYTVLDEFRAAHPEVVLEGCASGGLRVDLGLARHVHCLFMSDPDYTEHALQTLWGASHMLPPSSILHFSWSQWVGDHEPSRLDFSTLADSEFRATLRSAMLHRFGVSLRLPELPQRLVDVLGVEVRRYHQTFLPLVRDGVMRRLTAQPLRGGQGERTPAFQLSLSSRHAVVAFQLEGSSGVGTVMPAALEPNLLHSVTDLDTGSVRHATGAELMSDGLTVPARIGRLSSAAYLIESV